MGEYEKLDALVEARAAMSAHLLIHGRLNSGDSKDVRLTG